MGACPSPNATATSPGLGGAQEGVQEGRGFRSGPVLSGADSGLDGHKPLSSLSPCALLSNKEAPTVCPAWCCGVEVAITVQAALSGSSKTGEGAAARHHHREPRWHPLPPSSCTPVPSGFLSAGSLVTSPRNSLSATRLGGGFSVGSVVGPKAAERRVLRRHGPGTKPLPTPC